MGGEIARRHRYFSLVLGLELFPVQGSLLMVGSQTLILEMLVRFQLPEPFLCTISPAAQAAVCKTAETGSTPVSCSNTDL